MLRPPPPWAPHAFRIHDFLPRPCGVKPWRTLLTTLLPSFATSSPLIFSSSKATVCPYLCTLLPFTGCLLGCSLLFPSRSWSQRVARQATADHRSFRHPPYTSVLLLDTVEQIYGTTYPR
ncbi:hypothetical protein OG21DRAFT_627512 [Imleria badia]|nr:hypothetical protein OG21DRAFT_627512 [Imleria badia]